MWVELGSMWTELPFFVVNTQDEVAESPLPTSTLSAAEAPRPTRRHSVLALTW